MENSTMLMFDLGDAVQLLVIATTLVLAIVSPFSANEDKL